MIFPKGEVKHQDLSTAYTDLSALVMALKSEGFSGTMEIEFPESKGVLFIVSGEVVNAEAKKANDSKRILREEAVRHLLSLSHRKDGTVSVFRLPPDRVAVAANNLQNEVLFKGLSTDFTRLDRFLVKLREEKHDGFIEFLTKEQKPMGILFFQEGEVVDLYSTAEMIPTIIDRKLIPAFLENVNKLGVVFNVYRSQKEPPIKEIPIAGDGGDVKQIIPVLEEILSRVEKLADGGRKGTFVKVFKRFLIEKSADYPFLDPFAGELNYQDGRITFSGEAGMNELVKGIGEALRATINHLEKESPKNKMLPLKIKAEIESSLEEYREVIKRLGVEGVLSSAYR